MKTVPPELERMVDVVLAYRPEKKTKKKAKRSKKRKESER
jgi:hypothetical protein